MAFGRPSRRSRRLCRYRRLQILGDFAGSRFAALRVGSLAGVVSFITSDPEDFLSEDSNIAGLGRFTYDSASDEFSETAIFAGHSGNLSAMIAYTRRDDEDLGNEGDVGSTGQTRTLPNPQDTRSDALLGKIVFTPSPNHSIQLTGEYLDSFVFSDILSGRITFFFPGATTDSLTARDTVERARLSPTGAIRAKERSNMRRSCSKRWSMRCPCSPNPVLARCAAACIARYAA